jgi:hypothetical protein
MHRRRGETEKDPSFSEEKEAKRLLFLRCVGVC